MNDKAATKQEDLRQRLATVLADLNADGRVDGEAMFMLGSIAARTADLGQKTLWSELKPLLTKPDYARLLKQIADEGDALVAQGKAKQAYALQALGLSLVAAQEDDPVLREGEKILDALIDQTVVNYRTHAEPHLRKAH